MRLIHSARQQRRIGRWAAAYIVKRIREHKACCNRPFVLGLPTGSTPLGTYN